MKIILFIAIWKFFFQLLAERDSLQLKLSNIIRQNEHLREIAVSNAASGTVMQLPDLENKYDFLLQVY